MTTTDTGAVSRPAPTTSEMIRTARIRLGWTQARLAEALDMPANTLRIYERSERDHPWPAELRHALDRLLWLHNESPIGF